MRVLETGWRRLRRVWRSPVEEDVDDEFRFHLDMRADELMAAGLSRQHAEREARARFGDVRTVRDTLVSEGVRHRRAGDWYEGVRGVAQDVKFSVRALRREARFTLGVTLTLGLGIGANATMFGVIDRLMLRGPEGVVDARSVRRLYVSREQPGQGVQTSSYVGYVVYATLRDRAKSFAGVGAYTESFPARFGAGVEARPVPAAHASWDLFRTLGVRPEIGRFFNQSDDTPGKTADVAVISDAFWKSEFGGDAGVLGRRIQVGDYSLAIVGVAPAGFSGPDQSRTDIWLPITLIHPIKDWPVTWRAQWLRVVARLRPDVSPSSSAAEATVLLRNAYTGDVPEMRRLAATVQPLWFGSRGTVSAVANVARWLMGVAIVVLLIGCANVVNLLLARGRRRRREVAVRVALGAGHGRLLRFILSETILVALLGGCVAAVVAAAGSRVMHATLLSEMAWQGGVIDMRMFAFTVVVALAVGLTIGLLPMREARRTSVADVLKSGGRSEAPAGRRMRAGLAIAQSALCVVLLIGAGLFVRSLRQSRGVDLGFQPDRVVRVEPQFPPMDLPQPRRAAERLRRRQLLVDAVAFLNRQSWIEHAAVSVGSPYGNRFSVAVRVPGRDSIRSVNGEPPSISAVTGDYFATLGAALRRGRTFTPADRDGSAPVAIVNETMARTLWPNGDAIGRCLSIADAPGAACASIVGIVADMHVSSLREPAIMQYYVPFGQERGFGGSALLIRPRGDARAAVERIRQTLMSIPGMPYVQPETLRDAVEPEFRSWELGASMFTVFGMVAAIIAAIGLYSVISYLVADRTREIGVRIALGATRGRVMTGVLLTGAYTTVLGVIIGTAVALAFGHLVQPLLFDVRARDPLVLGTVAAGVVVIGVISAWLPARRASAVDPVLALRAE